MAGITPDPIGGQGYANVFKGNKAIDDLREDIKWNRLKKAKDDEAKKAIKLKPTPTPVDGWEIYDKNETDLIFQKLQYGAAKLKEQGIDPFTVPQFAADARKAEKLAAENKALQTQYAKSLDEANKLKAEGKIAEDDYNNYIQQWKEIGEVGGKWGKEGGMEARLDIVREKGLPPSPYNLVDLRKRSDELITVGKVTYENEKGVTTIDPNKYASQLANAVDELYDTGVRQGKWKTKDQAAVMIKGWMDETLDRSTTRVKEGDGTGGGVGTTRGGLVAVPSFEDLGTLNTAESRDIINTSLEKAKKSSGYPTTAAKAEHIKGLEKWVNNMAEFEKLLSNKRTKAIDFRVEGKNPPTNSIVLKRGTVFTDTEENYTQNPDVYAEFEFTPKKVVDLGNGDFLVTGRVKGAADTRTNYQEVGTSKEKGDEDDKSTEIAKETMTLKASEGGNATILLKNNTAEKKSFESTYLTDDSIEAWMKEHDAEYKKLGSDTWNKQEQKTEPSKTEDPDEKFKRK